jgi:hypothetical protein
LIVKAAIAAALLLLAGCSTGTPPAPSWSPSSDGWPYPAPVAWERFRPGLQAEIDAAGSKPDCLALELLFGEALSAPVDNPDVLTYIDRWGTHAGCARFTAPEHAP